METLEQTYLQAGDADTYHHSKLVARVAIALGARALGAEMPGRDEHLKILGTAAYTHDIGKTQDDTIKRLIREPRPLKHKERLKVNEHVELSARWVRQHDLGEAAARLVLAHHAYDRRHATDDTTDTHEDDLYVPADDGLEDDRQRLCAQSLAVADMYAALCMPRPSYRPWAYSPAEALTIIREQYTGDRRVLDLLFGELLGLSNVSDQEGLNTAVY